MDHFSVDQGALLSETLFALSVRDEFSSSLPCRLIKELATNESSRHHIREILSRIPEDIWQESLKEITLAQREGIRLVHIFNSEYPPCLREIADPPLVLFVQGNISATFSVSVVGTRNATSYGERCARGVSRCVVEQGGTVVSGLARGIDAHAHRGALFARTGPEDLREGMQGEAEGENDYRGNFGNGKFGNGKSVANPTIAVMGSGILDIYPAEHRLLARQIVDAGGGLISEFGVRRRARKYFFPRRNRIISGLSKALVVVEAAERSGSLITARFATEQGRDVYAVPGPIDAPQSRGCHMLLQEGASLLANISDVFESIPASRIRQSTEMSSVPAGSALTPLVRVGLSPEVQCFAAEIVGLLRAGGSANLDYLRENIQFPRERLNEVLCNLEIAELIERNTLGNYRLVELIDS